MSVSEPKPQPPSGGGINAILFFGFGIASGILLAFSGVGFLQDSASLIATVFLSAMAVVLLLGVIIFALRRLVWQKLFGFAEVQIEQFATPMAKVAERAIAGDPAGATAAARDLVALVLARYSWISTRRWIIAALTGLIAAMAALAGTALLFKQNQLIEAQTGLLAEQNAKIAGQTVLQELDLELAEAARNAALAVEITQIASDLGRILDRTEGVKTGSTRPEGIFNAITTGDLSRELVLRITSVSRATKPYRFLDLGVRAQSNNDRTRIAVARRRDEFPNTYARIGAAYGWGEPDLEAHLIDRPASPERGQLLSVLLGAGLYNLEGLNSAGLDLSFAALPNANILTMTAQGGLLDSADFTGSYLVEVDLGGAGLENARFRGCVVQRSSFAEVTAERIRPPYPASNAPMSTRANGADFVAAAIYDSKFTATQLLAANFDAALLAGVDFGGANLGLSTFRGAVVLQADWRGAVLKSADFDGAVVFGADALDLIAAAAAEGSFDPGRFRLDPMDEADLMKIGIVGLNLDPGQIAARTGGKPPYRVTRVQPFDDGLPP